MKVKWSVECGYLNEMPDQIIEIDDKELEDMNDEEINNHIRETIQEEFYQNVSYYWEIIE
jgi:hypothetical protein